MAGSDYTTASGTLTWNPGDSASKTFTVSTASDNREEGPETVRLTLSPLQGSLGSPATAILTINDVVPTDWPPEPVPDPSDRGVGPGTTYVPVGPLAVSLENGNVQTVMPLSNTMTADPTYDAAAAINFQPVLVYNSDTADPRPILETVWDSKATDPVPTTVKARLTWDNGSPQSWTTYSLPGGLAAGDTYLMAVQVDHAVTTSGYYHYLIELEADFSGAPTQVLRQVEGYAAVQANGSTYGYGWSVAGIDKLLQITANSTEVGELYISGAGGARYFTKNGDGTYTSPAGDFGTLAASGSNYVYTTPQQLAYTFNSSGYLTTETDPHNLTTTFAYSSNLPSTVTDPNGFVYTFAYSSSKLSTITAPGGGVATFSQDGSNNLTTITTADGANHTFAYNGDHNMTRADAGGSYATATYDATYHTATAINPGGAGGTLFTPRLTEGLNATLQTMTSDVAKVTDPRSNLSTYTLNQFGEPTKVQTPDGNSDQFTYNASGQETSFIDANGHTTTRAYSGPDLTSIQDALGNTATFTYDATFHKIATTQDQLGNKETFSYDAITGDLKTITDPFGKVTTMTWGAGGLLSSITDALNRTTTFGYTASRQLQTSEDPVGDTTTMSYDGAGNMTVMTDPMGRVTSYGYDGMGRVKTVTTPDGGVETMLYDGAGRVTSQTDKFGLNTQFQYDVAGRQSVTIDPLGNHTTRLFDAAGNVTEEIDIRGNATLFSYDALNRVTVTTDELGNKTTQIYDPAGNVTETIDEYGKTTLFQYDALNRATVTTDTLGNKTTQLYDKAGNVTESIDMYGKTTLFQYDALNRATVVTDVLGNKTTSMYNAAGELTETLDIRGNATLFQYDAAGRQNVVTDILGVSTTTLYNADGEVTGTVDPRGTTQFQYDSLGRQTVTIDVLNNKTTTMYSTLGDVTETIDANGNITQFQYDSLNRLTVTIDAATGKTTTLYSALGDVTGTLDARGTLTQYLLDSHGRQTQTVIDGVTQGTTLYDSHGRVSGTQDALGHLTQYLFDSFGRETLTIDPAGNKTTTMLDGFGRVTGIMDASNNLTAFGYDSFGRKQTETDANLNTTTFAYDTFGLLTLTTDPILRKTEYQYDSLNRITTQIWLDAGGTPTETMAYSYDNYGNMLTAGNSNGTYTMSYDALNRVTVVQDMWGDTLTFLYDAVGNRTQVLDSKGGTTTSVYNALNQLATIMFGGTTPLRVDLRYTADGQISDISRYSDLTGLTTVALTSFAYNPDDTVSHLQHKNGAGTNIANYTYTYDNAQNLLSEQRNGVTTSYGYDANNQLTSDGTQTMGFDGTGNRTYTFNGSTTATYATTTGNELTSDGTWSFTYDPAGNMSEKTKGINAETWTYGYNNANQMTVAVQWDKDPNHGGTELQEDDFKYDAFGNRIEQVILTNNSSSTQRYALDGWQNGMSPQVGTGPLDLSNWNVWADLDGGNMNALETRYLRGNAIDQLFARLDKNGSNWDGYWLLADRQQSVRDVVDNSGTVKDTISYDGYGNINLATETNSAFRGRYTYDSREYDTETDFLYYRRRYYSAKTGRWTSDDPMGFEAGDSNLYRYVRNRPTLSADPSGLEVWLLRGTGSGSVGYHYSIFWYDPTTNSGVWFTGGGPSGSSLSDSSSSSSSGTGTNAMSKRLPGFGFVAVYSESDPPPHTNSSYNPIKVETGMANSAAELKALDAAFKGMQQIKKYELTGPNSNTYARVLLERSGITAPPTPSDAIGWDYKGSFGYGGEYFNSNGTPKAAWFEYLEIKKMTRPKFGGLD